MYLFWLLLGAEEHTEEGTEACKKNTGRLQDIYNKKGNIAKAVNERNEWLGMSTLSRSGDLL